MAIFDWSRAVVNVMLACRWLAGSIWQDCSNCAHAGLHVVAPGSCMSQHHRQGCRHTPSLHAEMLERAARSSMSRAAGGLHPGREPACQAGQVNKINVLVCARSRDWFGGMCFTHRVFHSNRSGHGSGVLSSSPVPHCCHLDTGSWHCPRPTRPPPHNRWPTSPTGLQLSMPPDR